MKRTFYATMVVASAVFFSCKHELPLEKPFSGDAICASKDFAFTSDPELSSATVNLSVSSLNITASMNEVVPWTVKITQSSTGAYKTFSGRSSQIDIEWKGEPESENIFFAAGVCSVIVTPACKDPQVLSFTITNQASFSDYGTPVLFSGTGYAPGTSVSVSDNPSPQGGNSQKISGSSGWWIGQMGWSSFGLASAQKDPDNVYMNFYLRAEPGTSVTVTFKDSDGLAYKKSFIPANNGWVMISKPLSFWNVYDPSTLNFMEIGAGPLVENSYAEFAVDFIVFTYGEPFFTAN